MIKEHGLKKINKEKIFVVYGVLIMLIPLLPEILDFGFYSLKQTVYVTATMLTALVMLLFAVKEKKFYLSFFDGVCIIYILLVIVSTAFAKYGIVNSIFGKNGRGEGTLLILTYIITFAIFSKGYKYMAKTLKIGIIVAGIISLYAIIEVVLPESFASPFMFRKVENLAYSLKRVENIAITTMVNQNFLSSYISLFLPMLVFYYINNGKKISLILILSLFSALVFSCTLSGYFIFIIMYIVIIIYSLIKNKNINDVRDKVRKRILILTILFLVIFIVLNYINNGIYLKEFAGIIKELDYLFEIDDDFGTGRMNIWKTCVKIINKHKYLGIGPDSLKYEIHKAEYNLNIGVIIDKAHSEPLQIAVSTGILSAIIYLIFICKISFDLFGIIRVSFKKNTDKLYDKNVLYQHMILLGITSYILQSLGNISVVQVAPIYWAMLGLAAGIIYSEKNVQIKE